MIIHRRMSAVIRPGFYEIVFIFIAQVQRLRMEDLEWICNILRPGNQDNCLNISLSHVLAKGDLMNLLYLSYLASMGP